MADFSSLKQTIQAYIKQNGNEEITGNILQDVLLAMVSTLGDSAINSLASVLQDEITERQNQNGILQGNITAESTARQDADTALGGRIDGLQTAINGINTKLAEGYVYAGIATPSTNPGTISGKVFYIAVQAGTYTNLGGTVVTEGITILKYNGTSWVKEQALFTDGGVFDISAYHATGGTLAKYVDLAEALNGGANIPQSLQKGGMSVKFVQSSDNKYIQYFCNAQTFTTDVADWEKMDIRGKVNEKNGINLFNPNDPDVLIGQYINYNGVIGSGNYNASGWIPVEENKTYYCSFESKYGFRFVCCYDGDKNVIPTDYQDLRSFVTPQGCAFVRVSFKNVDLVYPYAQVSDAYIKYTPYNSVGGYLTTEDATIAKLSENNGMTEIPFTLGNIIADNVSIGTVVDTTFVTTNPGCVAFYDVKEGDVISLTAVKIPGSSYRLLAFIDADSKLLYVTPNAIADMADFKMVVPSSAKKIIVNATIASNPKLYVMPSTSNQHITNENKKDVDILNDAVKVCKSIVNPGANGNVYGKYLNGDTLVDGDYNTTDYMPVRAGEIFYSAVKDDRFTLRIVQFYTNTKAFIDTTLLSNVNTFTVPADASYVRVSFADAYDFDEISINNYGYTFIEYGVMSNTETAIGVDEKSVNLVNPYDTDARQGYYYASGYTPSEALDCTGYIPVEYGKTYVMHTDVNIARNNLEMRFVAFFNKNKEYISNIASVSNFTVDNASVAFAIVSFYNRDNSVSGGTRERSIVNMSITTEDISFFTKYNPILTPSLKNGMGTEPNSIPTKEYVDNKASESSGNVLEGKKWVACGDSFTHGDFTNSPTDDYIFTDGLYAGQYKVYPFFIGRRNKMTIINEAINGSTMTHISESSIAFSDTRYQNIPADADYITIKLGINDDATHKDCPIGTIDDADNTTFYGAWNVVLDYLIQHHPQAKIGIIVTNGSTRAIVDATIAIAQKWGISYLNEATDEQCSFMFRSNRNGVVSSIKAFRDEYWHVSNVAGSLNYHPNAKAHEYESTVVENWLRSL